MYSENDLQAAVAAGAISADAAQALRAHVAASRLSPMADEENIRLVTSFNDVFVTIACLLVIFSGAAAGMNDRTWLSGLLIAVATWLMAEVFTRRRRMALPSIIVLVAFVVGLGLFAGGLVAEALPAHAIPQRYVGPDGQAMTWNTFERYPWQDAAIALAAAIAGGIGAIAHWRRFRVAITIAAGTAALVLLLLAALAWATDTALDANPVLAPAAFACGLGVFAFAMRWDLSDRERRTQRADIAFWLHLLAAPLIAHSLFYWLGVLSGTRVNIAHAAGVLTIYVVFALVALVVDRRALLVSALLYVLIALTGLLEHAGRIELSLAIATLFVGSALLALSVFWSPLRGLAMRPLPAAWRARLPATA